jgi:MDMPI-like protein
VVRALRLNEYIIHGHDLIPALGRTIATPDWFIDRGLGDSFAMVARLHQRSPHKGKSASFHIHRTDGEGEWIIRAEGGQAVTEAKHGKADVAMRGPAEGLYWVIMGRGQPEEHGVEVHGDAALAAAFKEWFPGP